MEYYVHHVPGRLRIKIPSIKGRAAKSVQVKSLLAIDGVEDIAVNTITGSVVVTYQPERVSVEALLSILKHNGLYDQNCTIGCDEQIQRATQKAASHVGRAAFGWVVGKALEANGLSLLAAFI